MKKAILFFSLAALFAACGGSGSTDKKADSTATAPKKEADLSGNPDYQKGLALIGESDCFTCHKIDDKLTGPSYVEVANKYAGSDTAVSYLAKKIINGGSGVWGEAVMTPHPAIPQADAEAMAKYVLLMKK